MDGGIKRAPEFFGGRALDRETQANGPGACLAIPLQRPSKQKLARSSLEAFALVASLLNQRHFALKPTPALLLVVFCVFVSFCGFVVCAYNILYTGPPLTEWSQATRTHALATCVVVQ